MTKSLGCRPPTLCVHQKTVVRPWGFVDSHRVELRSGSFAVHDALNVAESSVESARETAVRRLATHATSGGLTLDEYAGRASAVDQAVTADEFDTALRGLPEQTAGGSPTGRAGWLAPVSAVQSNEAVGV